MKKGKGFTSLYQGKAERIAHLYALVIVQNRRKSTSEIHDGLQVLMAHKKEEHHRCPPGETSWCHYPKRLANYDVDEEAAPPTNREHYLIPGEYARAQWMYSRSLGPSHFAARSPWARHRMRMKVFIICCGITRPNPKHVGQKCLSASTALAVISSNDGSLAYSKLLHQLGTVSSHHTLLYLSRRDSARTKCEPAGSRRPKSVDAVRWPLKHFRRIHREGCGTSEYTSRRIMALKCSSWRTPRMSLTRCATPVGPDIVRWSPRGRGMTGSSASHVRSGTAEHAPDLGPRSLFQRVFSVTCVPINTLFCVNARKQ